MRKPNTDGQVWIDRIKALDEYKSGEWFLISRITSCLDKFNVPRDTAYKYLAEMEQRGDLTSKKVRRGIKTHIHYRKSRGELQIINLPWRKHTNRELLGDYCQEISRLGVML